MRVVTLALMVAAFVCFILAALDVSPRGVRILAAGLGCWSLSALLRLYDHES